MSKLQTKILNSLQTNKFNPTKTGERKWYDYFLSIDELVWTRNFIDGYLINIYSDECKSEHLATYTLTYDIFERKDIIKIVYEKVD